MFPLRYELNFCVLLRRNQQKSYKIMRMNMFAVLRQGEVRHKKYMRLKFGCGQAYDRSSD
jgi:hypothetical protein